MLGVSKAAATHFSLSLLFFKYISVALVTRRKVYVCVYLSLYIITRGGVYYFALTIEHKDQKREMLESA
jgi:hypothetical protein